MSRASRRLGLRRLIEPSCADIDVAGLHAACLRASRGGGAVRTDAAAALAQSAAARRTLDIDAGPSLRPPASWSTPPAPGPIGRASAAASRPLGIAAQAPDHRPAAVGPLGPPDLPLVIDAPAASTSRAKATTAVAQPARRDPTEPCDAAPEEIDVATAIDRFEQVGRLAGRGGRAQMGRASELRARPRCRSTASIRTRRGFFWCAGQGGFGIQTAPAASALAAALLLGDGARSDRQRHRPGDLRARCVA